jgi:hypothetical protein
MKTGIRTVRILPRIGPIACPIYREEWATIHVGPMCMMSLTIIHVDNDDNGDGDDDGDDHDDRDVEGDSDAYPDAVRSDGAQVVLLMLNPAHAPWQPMVTWSATREHPQALYVIVVQISSFQAPDIFSAAWSIRGQCF